MLEARTSQRFHPPLLTVTTTTVDPGRKPYGCGSIASLINIMVTFPIQKVMFRQQLHGVLASEAVRQLQREGVRTLYRGLLPPLLQH